MGKQKFRRKHYLIHPSIQLKFIGMTILPALILCVFSTHLLIKTGEVRLIAEKGRINLEISSLNMLLDTLKNDIEHPQLTKSIIVIKKRILALQNSLAESYYNAVVQWYSTSKIILLYVVLSLTCVALLALFYSHRIAGPILRIRKTIDSMAQGQKIYPITLRDSDEFKEVADSLNNLIRKLAQEETQ